MLIILLEDINLHAEVVDNTGLLVLLAVTGMELSN